MATISDALEENKELLEALQMIFESSEQAEYDFVGEQRDWHLPRLQKAAGLLVKLFPMHSVKAMGKAQTPYGDNVA